MSTFVNSEDPDETPQIASHHLGFALYQTSEKEM